jgi:putative hydrolase of the HAD superfamily
MAGARFGRLMPSGASPVLEGVSEMAAVIFDLDDTLYPHAQYVNSGFGAVARHVQDQFGLPAERVYTTLRIARDGGARGREFQQLCASHRLDVRVVPELVQVYRAHMPQIWLMHGAVSILQRFRAEGWRIAVLTNGDPVVQGRKVLALGLESLVDHVVYASNHARGGKPAREPFVEALCRLQVAPHNAVMVGDDPVNDVEGARAVGIRTIFLMRPTRGHAAADAAIRLLTDVPRVAGQLVHQGIAHAA